MCLTFVETQFIHIDTFAEVVEHRPTEAKELRRSSAFFVLLLILPVSSTVHHDLYLCRTLISDEVAVFIHVLASSKLPSSDAYSKWASNGLCDA